MKRHIYHFYQLNIPSTKMRVSLEYKSFFCEKYSRQTSATEEKAKLFIVCKLFISRWKKKFITYFTLIRKTLSIFAFQCQMLIFHDFADNLFKFDSLPERIFRAKLKITSGDKWTTELADQSSLRFQHRSKFYQDAIDQMINRSDLKEGYKRSEVLALDG